MKNIKNAIPFLLIALFAYVAMNKFLDIDRFRLSMQSAGVSAGFSRMVAYTVPVIEALVTLLLMVPFTRRMGMQLAAMLIVGYMFFILHVLFVTKRDVCTCVGLTDALSWSSHIWVNIGLLVLIIFWIYPLNKAVAEKPLSTE